nr:ATP-binding cassette domain-containing protein [Diplocloster agilis]
MLLQGPRGDRVNEILRLDHVQFGDANGNILSNFNFSVQEGEVHGIIGDYGVTHSTLCSLCTGTLAPERGQIYYCDQPVGRLSFAESRQKGLYAISEGKNLQSHMTVLENIYLIARREFGWQYRRRQIAELARQYLDFFDVSIPLQEHADNLTDLQSCIVSMTGAIIAGAKLFILDEITSSLNEQDAIIFQKVLSCLKYKGLSVVCMVHRIEELVRYTDRATLVKNGSTVRCMEKNDYSYDKMLAMLLI